MAAWAGVVEGAEALEDADAAVDPERPRRLVHHLEKNDHPEAGEVQQRCLECNEAVGRQEKEHGDRHGHSVAGHVQHKPHKVEESAVLHALDVVL